MDQSAGEIEVGLNASGNLDASLRQAGETVDKFGKKVNSKITRADGQFNKLDGSVTKTEKSMQKLQLAAKAFIALQIAKQVGRWVGAFSEAAAAAEEVESKFKAVLGAEAELADAFANDLGEKVGRSTLELKGYIATLQDTFVPMGLARDDARKLSQELTELAVDVASFSDKADADVIRDFQSALVGNTETVRKYGIVITEARMKQEALNMGYDPKALTELNKIQIRHNMIMEGTKDAQGDAVRTAGSFTNAQKRMAGAITDMQVAFGNLLNKELLPFVQVLGNKIIPHIEDLVTAFGRLGDESKTTGGDVREMGDSILPILTKVAESVKLITDGFGYLYDGASLTLLTIKKGLAEVNVAAIKAGNFFKEMGGHLTNIDTKMLHDAEAEAAQIMDDMRRIADGIRDSAANSKTLKGELAKINDEHEEAKKHQEELLGLEEKRLDVAKKQGNAVIKAAMVAPRESDEDKTKRHIGLAVAAREDVDQALMAFVELKDRLAGLDPLSGAALAGVDKGALEAQLADVEAFWQNGRAMVADMAENMRRMDAIGTDEAKLAAGIYGDSARAIEQYIGEVGALFSNGKEQLNEIGYIQSLVPDAESLRESLKTDFEIRQEHMAKLIEMERVGLITRAQYEEQLSKMKQQQIGIQISSYGQAASAILGIFSGQSKKAFEAQKALNIGLTTMSTAASVMETFKNNGGYPFGIGPAIAVAAQGAAQIATISQQKFNGGGGKVAPISGGGGSGGGAGGSANTPAPIQRTTLNLSVSGGLADRAQTAQEVVKLLGEGLGNGGSIDQINLEER